MLSKTNVAKGVRGQIGDEGHELFVGFIYLDEKIGLTLARLDEPDLL